MIQTQGSWVQQQVWTTVLCCIARRKLTAADGRISAVETFYPTDPCVMLELPGMRKRVTRLTLSQLPAPVRPKICCLGSHWSGNERKKTTPNCWLIDHDDVEVDSDIDVDDVDDFDDVSNDEKPVGARPRICLCVEWDLTPPTLKVLTKMRHI